MIIGNPIVIGGERDKPFELIYSRTLSSAVSSVEVTEDLSGEPFSLKDVVVNVRPDYSGAYMEQPKVYGYNVNFMYVNDTAEYPPACYVQAMSDATTGAAKQAYYDLSARATRYANDVILSGIFRLTEQLGLIAAHHAAFCGGSNASAVFLGMLVPQYARDISKIVITERMFAALPAGTTIEIYGVRV